MGEKNLQGADLQGDNLQDADLKGANLKGAYLQDADLRNANLRYANLENAHLQGADLQGANLTGVDLRNVDFDHANVTSIPPSDANRNWIFTDLGVTKNLTQDQLNTMRGDSGTIIPPHLKRPSHWPEINQDHHTGQTTEPPDGSSNTNAKDTISHILRENKESVERLAATLAQWAEETLQRPRYQSERPNDPDVKHERDILLLFAEGFHRIANSLSDNKDTEEPRKEVINLQNKLQKVVEGINKAGGVDVVKYMTRTGLLGIGTAFLISMGAPPIAGVAAAGLMLTSEDVTKYIKIIRQWSKIDNTPEE